MKPRENRPWPEPQMAKLREMVNNGMPARYMVTELNKNFNSRHAVSSVIRMIHRHGLRDVWAAARERREKSITVSRS